MPEVSRMTYWEWVRRQLQHPVKKPKPRPVKEILDDYQAKKEELKRQA